MPPRILSQGAADALLLGQKSSSSAFVVDQLRIVIDL
jgi:hypothetical protein